MALMNGIVAAFFASASSFMYAKEGDPATAEDFALWSGLSWLLVVILPSALLALGITSSWRIRGRSDGVIGLAMNVFVCALWMIVSSRYMAN
ncbi:MAG: hypothetical protein DCC64_15270 [Planctomycetota bacterium]|nr:MAG: hypothetical protein DCC64_15270 [Planctomycetota bacterium]